MTIYSLKPLQEPKKDSSTKPQHGLGGDVLIHNVRWFIKVRWIVLSVFAAAGVVTSLWPGFMPALGLAPARLWPWVLCGVLAAANIIFLVISRDLDGENQLSRLEHNIWAQIACDLLIVTALVHFMGSTTTFISFTYLFHIVLSCVFFSPSRSFAVTLIAALLFLGCVSIELAGIWPVDGMQPPVILTNGPKHLVLLHASSAVSVWFVVWALAASLSQIVADRTFQLEAANQRLRIADEDKNQIVLRTTHDLKAPFSGIESNIQILKLQHWGDINEKVKEIILRIEVRAQTLAERIRDILVLGSLRSENRPEAVISDIDLRELFDNILLEIEDRAKTRRIGISMEIPKMEIHGEQRLYFILFSNLLTNAVLYSRENGTVRVKAEENDKAVVVTVQDTGIGITENDLPHIFDEYYRSRRAAQYNSRSTGLGLAIVKEIAQREKLDIEVSSEEEKGTTFSVTIRKQT